MYELIQVSDNCYYIQSPSKIGLVKLNDTEVCLIDSGNNRDAGKKIYKILEANGWVLKMIINTHSHADHIGGNRYLQEQTGCKIYAKGIECDFTNHTILEPISIFGAYPPSDLRHKFIVAQESGAQELTDEVLPDGVEIIPLKGHSFDMVGLRIGNIVYLADCLSSKQTLDKYGIGFIYDVGEYIATLEKVKTLQAKLFIPAHAEPTDNITELAQYNIDKVNEIADKICELCTEPLCFEEILQRLFNHYGLQLNFEQYALCGSTVRSYLAWLKDSGRIAAKFENNMLIWEKC